MNSLNNPNSVWPLTMVISSGSSSGGGTEPQPPTLRPFNAPCFPGAFSDPSFCFPLSFRLFWAFSLACLASYLSYVNSDNIMSPIYRHANIKLVFFKNKLGDMNGRPSRNKWDYSVMIVYFDYNCLANNPNKCNPSGPYICLARRLSNTSSFWALFTRPCWGRLQATWHIHTNTHARLSGLV